MDTVDVFFNGVVEIKVHVKEWRLENVDLISIVMHKSKVPFGFRHASSPGVEGVPKKKKGGRRWRLGVERFGRREV
ncbi:hypothetical protein KFK09_015490 [Dendrobium nobile]|uniref:Uncharacterized protein n=1 Tax=Dendrobium nobile TaxID=94219 RepID=A0A8T3B636_DENNO|nr:hypothetical protein KFK09_015490 [Dendrobium nobile]